jgi:hypothetical protein
VESVVVETTVPPELVERSAFGRLLIAKVVVVALLVNRE